LTDKEKIAQLENDLRLLLKEFSLFREEMTLKVTVLETENKVLKEKLKKYEHPKNSNNSSVPPSQDRFRKTTSSREKSTKKIGGQKGHKGNKLSKVSHPDKTIFHDIEECGCCGDWLGKEGKKSSRQLFDLPEIKMLVTEHITVSKTCKSCGEVNKSKFPKGLVQEAQYGDRVKSFCVYLQNYQMLPFERCAELLEDLTGQGISQGSLANFQKVAHAKLSAYEDEITQLLLQSEVNHADETGVNLNGKNTWIHVLSNQNMTFFGHHIKRGKEAIDSFGIIPKYNGTLIHDRFSSYFSYNCKHSLCNAHILRELKYVEQAFEAKWSKKLTRLLTQAHRLKKKDGACTTQYYNKILEEYQQLIKPIIENYNTVYSKTDEERLAFGLEKHKELFLKFIKEKNIPFDNNLAERDLRMIKVKLKISGLFKSSKHAQYFARIRGYISTVKKNNENVLECLVLAFQNNPFIPLMGE
jgi:transposase